MQRILLVLALAIFVSPAFAQQKSENCFQKYNSAFEERGSKQVEDGDHEKVIITVRKGALADCFYGKAKVKDNEVKKIYIMFEDGTYGELEKEYKHNDVPLHIINGISRNQVTINDELVNVIFVNHIKPKKKDFMKAPDPDFDF